ncbi:hypothetical protein [Niabella hibiscisoli]|uniref:hypothetical protein n=1 Tax=Niabella hibiscisoli TaxID=1825928 RepID=UPI001F0FF353|nr:hypothetical protein [Niabella hibiscisoli]MCH5718937.1 hypothetical protein [Niabella hibiscisoli]
MYTLLTICCFMGFFHQYNTSAKARFSGAGHYEKWLRANPAKARWTGLLLMLVSLLVLVLKDGWMLGFFTFILLLMAGACYVIALAPLGYIKLKHILLLAVFSLLIELIILK